MNISLEYFLAVAEEESISRGAERVMVSQQDMSNHIRRLEKQYGLLFERRPRFALTPAGGYHATCLQNAYQEQGLYCS